MAGVYFGDLLAYPLRSGVSIPAGRRGSGIKMLNMGELFRYPRVPAIEMARVEIPEYDADRTLLRRHDLLFARRSLTLEGAGKCSIVDAVDEPTTWEGSILRARLDSAIAHPPYYFYYFASPQGRRSIETIVEQVAAAGIRGSDLKKLRVPHPGLLEQHAVADVLGALDDKIAANTKLAQTAMDLAEAQFRRLMYGASEVTSLGDVLSLEYGKSLPTSQRIQGNVAVYGSGGLVGTHNAALLAGPGVIVGRKGTAGAVHWSPGPFYPIDTTFHVVPKVEEASAVYCYFLLKTLRLDEMNSDSAVPGLNRAEAHAAKCVYPPVAQIRGFTQTGTHLLQLASQTERENNRLATTRDTILPQLMSGKLRVKDAEKVLVNARV